MLKILSTCSRGAWKPETFAYRTLWTGTAASVFIKRRVKEYEEAAGGGEFTRELHSMCVFLQKLYSRMCLPTSLH